MATTKVINDIIDFNQTNQTQSLKGCVGTTANRPASPSNGDIRTNTDLSSASSTSVMEFYRDTGVVASSGWFPLTNSALPVAYVTSDLAVYLSAKDGTSTANFSSGTNAANTQWVDLSGNSRNGTFAVYSGSNAFSYDTTSKIITTNSTTKLSHPMPSGYGANFTVELWVKLPTAGIYVQSASMYTGGGFINYIQTPGTNDDLQWASYTGTTDYYNPNVDVSVGVWHQIVQSYSSNVRYGWIDGSSVATSTRGAGRTAAGANASIDYGFLPWGSSNSFVGELGIIRVYTKALSDAEVLQNFNADKADFGL